MPTKKPGAPAAPKAATRTAASSAKAKILDKGEKVTVKKGPVGPPPLPVHGLGKVVAAVKSKLKPKK